MSLRINTENAKYAWCAVKRHKSYWSTVTVQALSIHVIVNLYSYRAWNNVPKVPDHGDRQSWLSLFFQVGNRNPAFPPIISNSLPIIDWWSVVISSSVLKGHSTPRTSVAHKKALYEPTLEWIFVRLNSFSFARNLTLFHWFFVHYRRHVCWIRGWSYECRDVSVW
jgi:hypothetical protein